MSEFENRRKNASQICYWGISLKFVDVENLPFPIGLKYLTSQNGVNCFLQSSKGPVR